MAPNFDDGNSLYNFVVRDGNGVKGMVDLCLEKVPEQYIQPQHERIDKLKASSYDRLPIDLSMLDGPQHSQVVGLIYLYTKKGMINLRDGRVVHLHGALFRPCL